MLIIQWNRSGRPRPSGMPEKLADAISKVLNSEIFPRFARIIDCFPNASTVICLTKAKVLLP